MLEHFPERSGELDAYLAHILGLSCSYTGNAYWHYHSLFTKKAASLWERWVKVHWGVPDPVLLHAAIASQRANYCEHCQNILHPTSQCPFSVAPVTKPPGGKGHPQPGKGMEPLQQHTVKLTTRVGKYATTLISSHVGFRTVNFCIFADPVSRRITP